MKTKLNKNIILLLLMVIILLFSACAKSDYNIGDYGYDNPNHDYGDNWGDLPLDDGMKIDGIFNEAIYNGLDSFNYIAGDEGQYTIDLVVAFGVKGLYFKTEVEDKFLAYNTSQDIWQNSSMILNIAPYGSLDQNTVQLRVGLNGITEQWIGLPSRDGYPYSRKYVPNMSKHRIYDVNGLELEYQLNQDVSYADTQGYVVESFLPYSSIGHTILDKILVAPEINAKISFSGVRDGGNYIPENAEYNKPITWPLFDKNGYNASGNKPTKPEYQPSDAPISGNISDWDKLGQDIMTNNTRTVANLDKEKYGDKQVTFYGFLGSDGLYLAALAQHELFIETAEEWHRNTNFEIFINGENQRWVIKNDKAYPNDVAIMKSIDSGSGYTRYTTTAMLFIPFETIPAYNNEQFVRVGLAWKTPDDKSKINPRDEDDWWWEDLHYPRNSEEQYFVYNDGIYENAKNIL